ncbi:hypothetical protein CAPTEDRAFT_170403 [Capitella teleta]|uniref:C2H2-type domain-containing protein n=1 Tax=Capitella teleta TaxID=283909 RepID=R7U434_CAPTE|nr:hypothetical protein CAPTEDRAFT_170403 [Capitella teleta]|eukprot:ELU00876.1 hypothetical protein CAPTEDRAFT_170403 [Capitella teleta]
MISQQLPSTLVTPSRASFAAEVSTPQLSNLISTAAAIAPAASNYHAESPSQEEFLKVEQAPSHDLKTLSPLSFPTEPPPPPTPKEDTPIDDAAATFREPEEPDAADSATQKLEINLQIDDNQFVMENGTKKWTCLQCPKTYSSKHNLITHVLGHSGIKPHCCLMCGKFFKQQSHLHTHMLTHGNVKPHACKICQRSFTQASHMKRHMAVHMQKRPHICSVCERGFVYPCELKIHMAKHKNGKANVCADCDESFSSLKKLRLHMQVAHKDQTSLTCPECGKSFTYPSQLKDHMLKHEGKRPYICSECGMDFVKEHHLKAHAFTHTGLRPFVCLVCDRAFNQKANLLRHMVVHDEQRKFECNTCHRTFTQAQVLRAHMVTHAEKKPHTCKKCGKGFSRLHNLNGHMHMHGGEKPHTCFCGASFTLKGNLNRHKKEKHNISAGSEISTEEEAAFILNEMSAGRRSRVNSEDHERHDLSPKKLKTVETSEDQHTSTTDLSSIDLITRFVSLNDDAGSRANGEAASGSSLATIGLREEHSERPSTRKGGRVGRRSNPLLSVIPPPIIVSQVNNADTASRAKTKADIVLPPKRRVSEIEKETGLL